MFPKSKPELQPLLCLTPPNSLPFVSSACLQVRRASSLQSLVSCNRAGREVMGCCEGVWGREGRVAAQTRWQPTCQQVLSIIGERRPRDSATPPFHSLSFLCLPLSFLFDKHLKSPGSHCKLVPPTSSSRELPSRPWAKGRVKKNVLRSWLTQGRPGHTCCISLQSKWTDKCVSYTNQIPHAHTPPTTPSNTSASHQPLFAL